jgi:hypothetical protein
MDRACSTKVGEEECVQDINGKARRKETLGRPKRRWVDNIKMDLREIEWDGVDWIDMAQDRDRWGLL